MALLEGGETTAESAGLLNLCTAHSLLQHVLLWNCLIINPQKQMSAKNPCSHEPNIYKYTADYTTNTNVNVEEKKRFHFTPCALCSAVLASGSALRVLNWFTSCSGWVNWLIYGCLTRWSWNLLVRMQGTKVFLVFAECMCISSGSPQAYSSDWELWKRLLHFSIYLQKNRKWVQGSHRTA